MTAPSFAEAFRFWLKLGFISFGGPAGQIAIMQHELVDRRRWIDQNAFLQALNFCMLLPGPEAQQLATYIGWKLHGVRGGLTAGILFVVPGALVLYALAWIAAAYGKVGPIAAIFAGLKPVVVAIVLHAIWRIGRRTLTGGPAIALAAASFLAMDVARVPFPLVILVAGAIGWLASRGTSQPFAAAGHGPGTVLPDVAADGARPAPAIRVLGMAALYVLLLVAPVGLTIAAVGPEPFLALARFFTQAAFVTFGGAYAVLPYVASAAVDQFQWLSPDEMINGLALAETTPGPLILVLQYVGFFAGWNAALAGGAGGLSPIAAATVGAAVTTYATFLPSLFFILTGAPYVERIARVKAAAGALAAITAAVVGGIMTLAVFFAEQVVVDPAGTLDVLAAAAVVLAFGVLVRFGVSLHWLVLAGAAFGLLRAAAEGRL